ncbi:MAG: hypothetical protein ACRELD_04015, partial [Longimicrobiales bacterium]
PALAPTAPTERRRPTWGVRRGRAAEGPPPLLEGQVVQVRDGSKPSVGQAPKPESAPGAGGGDATEGAGSTSEPRTEDGSA